MSSGGKYDVLVIGAASAGLAAAVAAQQAGAERVLVLEKAPRDELGGNCRFSEMGFRFVHEGHDDLASFLPKDLLEEIGPIRIRPYSADEFTADLDRVTQGRMDRELASVLVEDSRQAIEWMTELGHTWRLRGPVSADGYTHFDAGTALCPTEGGLGLVQTWLRMAEEAGVEVRFDTRVSGLVGDYNRVTGALVDGPDERYEIEATSTILASGGFQASAERRGRYLETNADLMKVRGSRFNTGEVLQYAVDLGALTSGQWQGAHASPVDADGPRMEMDDSVNRYAYPYGISVNQAGERFFDEGEAHRTYTYAKTGWKVLRESGGLAYQIYDDSSVEFFPVEYADATPVMADTVSELAAKIGIDPQRLEATVAEFNAAVDDSIPFDATVQDGRRTDGLSHNKSNWSQPLTTPPFRAYKVTAGITFTFGGVGINRHSQVLNTSGRPIDGLFANGDILGLFFHNYPSCTGMTRNAVFGGRAGASAAGI